MILKPPAAAEETVHCEVPEPPEVSGPEMQVHELPSTPQHQRNFIGAKLHHRQLYANHVRALFDAQEAQVAARKLADPTEVELQRLGFLEEKHPDAATRPPAVEQEMRDISARRNAYNLWRAAKAKVTETKAAYEAYATRLNLVEAEHRAELAIEKANAEAAETAASAASWAQQREARILEQLEAMKRERVAAVAATRHVGSNTFGQ